MLILMAQFMTVQIVDTGRGVKLLLATLAIVLILILAMGVHMFGLQVTSVELMGWLSVRNGVENLRLY